MTDTKVNYSAPDGRLILPVDAPRADWLATRHLGVGGTDVATITGANKYQTPFEAWASKLSPDDTDAGSDAMWWGSYTEAGTVDRFEARTGLSTRRAGTYAHRIHEHHLVNPDRFTSDGGVLECKDHEMLTDAGKQVMKGQITDHAYAQLMWACHVTGRSHGWFAAKIGKTTKVLGPFPRDEECIAVLVAAADVFWEQVCTNTPPPMNADTVTADELAARFPTVNPDSTVDVDDQPLPDIYLDDLRRLAEIKAGAADLDGEKDVIETRLKSLLGDREYLLVAGKPVYRWQQIAGRRTFDKAASVKALAALTAKTPVEVDAEFTKQSAPTRRFSPIAQKDAA